MIGRDRRGGYVGAPGETNTCPVPVRHRRGATPSLVIFDEAHEMTEAQLADARPRTPAVPLGVMIGAAASAHAFAESLRRVVEACNTASAAIGRSLLAKLRRDLEQRPDPAAPHAFTPTLDLACRVCGNGPEDCLGRPYPYPRTLPKGRP